MNKKSPHLQLVRKENKVQLPIVAKIYGGSFLLVLGFLLGWLFVSLAMSDKKIISFVGEDSSPVTRLPILMDRVVKDSSAYVYVKHASIRSELGIPWGQPIGLKKKEKY